MDNESKHEAGNGEAEIASITPPVIPSEEPSTRDSTADDRRCYRQEAVYSWVAAGWAWVLGVEPTTLFNFLVMCATVATAIFNWRLVGVNRDMASAARDSATASKQSAALASDAIHHSRPVLWVTKLGANSSRGGQVTAIIYDVKIKNLGDAPADIIGYACRSELVPAEKRMYLTDDEQWNRLADPFVESNSERHAFYSVPLPVTPDELDRLRRGDTIVVCYGEIRYRSPIGRQYFVQFTWFDGRHKSGGGSLERSGDPDNNAHN